jgi:hypothetical protein
MLDTSFGTGGTRRVQTATGDGNSFPSDVTVQADGRVLLLGSSRIGPSEFELVLLRLETDGDLDTTFGAGGLVRLSPGDEATGARLALSPEGQSVVVTGTATTGTVLSGLVTRILLTEVTPTTTTTTLPGGCSPAPSIAGARCRVAALGADVTAGVPAGKLQRRWQGPSRAGDRWPP